MPATVRLRSCVLFVLLLPFAASAATPSAGTLTPTSGPLAYSSGPFLQPNPTPIPEYDIGPECNNPIEVCDFYALSVALPSGYAQTYPQAHVEVTLSWTDAGTGKSDYDLWLFRGTVSGLDGGETADWESASSANPEVADMSILSLPAGTSK